MNIDFTKIKKVNKPSNELIAKELDSLTKPEVKYSSSPKILTLSTPEELTPVQQFRPGELTVEQQLEFFDGKGIAGPIYPAVMDKPAKTAPEDDKFLNKKNIIIGSVILLVVIIVSVIIYKSKSKK